MWPSVVAELQPLLDHDSGIAHVPVPFAIQAFNAQLAFVGLGSVYCSITMDALPKQ